MILIGRIRAFARGTTVIGKQRSFAGSRCCGVMPEDCRARCLSRFPARSGMHLECGLRFEPVAMRSAIRACDALPGRLRSSAGFQVPAMPVRALRVGHGDARKLLLERDRPGSAAQSSIVDRARIRGFVSARVPALRVRLRIDARDAKRASKLRARVLPIGRARATEVLLSQASRVADRDAEVRCRAGTPRHRHCRAAWRSWRPRLRRGSWVH
jgi:hypothetical protein